MPTSLSEIVARVAHAWESHAQNFASDAGVPLAYSWVREVFNDSVWVVFDGAQRVTYNIPYSLSEDMAVTFSERDSWQELTLEMVAANSSFEEVHQTVTFQVNAANSRTETKQGREFIVIPAVTAKGVMNRIFYPASELENAIPTCNGRMVTIGHPKDNKGNFLFGNQPTIDAYGAFFNGFVQKGALAGEIWLDKELANNDGEKGEFIVNSALDGRTLNVSWGFILDLDPTTGTFNGEAYDGIARNIRGDHLAILPDEVGACSVDDGCGTSRTANEAEPDTFKNKIFSVLRELIPTLQTSNQLEEGDDVSKDTDETKELVEEVEVEEAEVVNEAQSPDLAETIRQAVNEAVQPLADKVAALEAKDRETVQEEAETLRAALKANERVTLAPELIDSFDLEQLKGVAASFKQINMGAAGGNALRSQQNGQVYEKPMPTVEA